jgi:hypothetical protein
MSRARLMNHLGDQVHDQGWQFETSTFDLALRLLRQADLRAQFE